jgi:hypothetical protein
MPRLGASAAAFNSKPVKIEGYNSGRISVCPAADI